MPVQSELSRKAVTPSGDPIMAAKLRVPVAPPWAVARPHLLDRISRGVEGPLTLVSAPAGSGKTLLVSSWAASGLSPGTVVWISLDEQDTQPGVLWSYILAGLRQAGVPVTQVGLPTGANGSDHSLLVRLAACLSDLPHPVVLILDNTQLVTGPTMPEAVDFLLRHAVPQLRLVLIGRFDPALPLHRYRVAGSISELRFDDLALTPREIGAMLSAHGTHLPEPALAELGRRTRGWAAGVRLAALALQHRSDSPAAEEYVADNDGTIADYFVAEVLDAQSPDIRDFLLRTSVVDRVWPGLADELSGRGDAQRILTTLAHTDTFVAPTPKEREGYEYHPLVRDLLRTQLRHEAPQTVGQLHQTAARWLAGTGRVTDAAVHACAAGDWEHAATLVIQALTIGRMIAAPGTDQLMRALADMPASASTPEAAVVLAVLALRRNEFDACAKHLVRASELVATRSPDRSGALRLSIAVTEMTRARMRGEVTAALSAAADAEAALSDMATHSGSAVPSPDLPALLLLGKSRALLHAGDVTAAATTLADGLPTTAHAAGCERWWVECLGHLAMVEALRGHLRRATELGRKARVAADRCGLPVGQQPPTIDLALAWVHTERYDSAAARVHADRAGSLVRAEAAVDSVTVLGDPVVTGLLAIVHARMQRARGDIGGAVATIDRVRNASPPGPVPQWLSDRLATMRAMLRAASGTPETPTGDGGHTDATGSPQGAMVRALTRHAAGRPQRPTS